MLWLCGSYLTGLSGVALVKTEGVRAAALAQTAFVGQLVEDRVVRRPKRHVRIKSLSQYQIREIVPIQSELT